MNQRQTEAAAQQKVLKSKQTTAQVIGGAAAVVVVWMVTLLTQVQVPVEVAAAFGAILTFGAGFLPRTNS